MTGNTTRIEHATQAWIRGWCARDHKTLLALWDIADDQAVYRPAERVEPLIGNEPVTTYVSAICTTFNPVQHRAIEPVYRRLSDKTGLAFYTLNWMFSDQRGPIGGTCRVTALWRQTGDAWRLFHYAEAPLAPLLELQEFYEDVAAEGLDAIPTRAYAK